MINDVSKHRIYFKEEKTFENRWKPFEKQQNIFFIVRFRKEQEGLLNGGECLRDRSISERFPFFKNTFFFLKKNFLIFRNAFSTGSFWNIFHWVRLSDLKENFFSLFCFSFQSKKQKE